MTLSGRPSDRTEEVLDPAFVEGLESLDLDELRRRRDRSLAERDYQSYLRRLVQVRQDILSAEQARREAGRAEEPLIDRLTAVLSKGSRAPGRGEALRMSLDQGDMDAAERWLQERAPAIDVANPDALSDGELGEAIDELGRGEREVSDRRTSVLRVHDRLQDEVKRRYREDPSVIPTST
jgi:hypothetical protein